MPTKPERRITAVSYSRYRAYNECPLKCWLQNGEKIFDPTPSPTLDRGTAIHKMGEAFVSGAVPKVDRRDAARLKPYDPVIATASKGKLPSELSNFKKEFAKVRKLGSAIVEQEWAFDINWNPTSWFANSGPTAAFLRVKIDLHYVEEKGGILPIIDYKTGKIYPEEGREQIELYGLAGLLMIPTINVVRAALWYLDQGEVTEHEFNREELPALKKLWLKRFTPMLKDRKFPAKPSDKCRWCFYRKSNTANNGTGRELCQHG